MAVKQAYQDDLACGRIQPDAVQAAVVERLSQLEHQLVRLPPDKLEDARPWLKRMLNMGEPSLTPVKGLYLWGGVGRGKTYLMDLFCENLPFEDKHRVHFHAFMQDVHTALATYKGMPDPLHHVARQYAERYRLICLDEFFVSDITDAMLLARLLMALFQRGVTLVVTSNVVPDNLYKDGLQRARFLPAIDLIKRHLDVIELDIQTDYRLRRLTHAHTYFYPADSQADTLLGETFMHLAPNPEAVRQGHALVIKGRPIKARQVCEDLAWFSFTDLCESARAASDYVELARLFHAVMVSGVPPMGPGNEDVARRFINLVDAFYDAGVKLFLSAQVPLADLYDPAGRLAFEFERTRSRLTEMQSREYLAGKHNAG